MKTSNYILFSFLIFLFGGILWLFVGAKNYEANEKNATLTQVKKTAAFSIVVAEPGAYLVLKNGDENKISQKYKKLEKSNFASFEVRNDTLFVSATKLKFQGKWLTVPEVYCKNLKTIIAKENSNINLDNYSVDSLSVHLDKSYLHWQLDKSSYLKVVAQKSLLNIDGQSVGTLNLQLNETRLDMFLKSDINLINGNLTNHSKLYFNLNGRINLKVDSSSYISSVQRN